MDVIRQLLGFSLGLLVRLWAATWRVRVVAADGALAPSPAVFAFWHGRQAALVGARGRPGVVMVSRSKDGSLQAGVMRALGLGVVRGSSSRGGVRALVGLVRALRTRRADALFAVDGPRGPAFRPKPGAACAARLAGATLSPVGSAVSRALSLGRAWDGFELPWPFARVIVVVGPAVSPHDAERDPAVLARAIERAHVEARALLAGEGRALDPVEAR